MIDGGWCGTVDGQLAGNSAAGAWLASQIVFCTFNHKAQKKKNVAKSLKKLITFVYFHSQLIKPTA